MAATVVGGAPSLQCARAHSAGGAEGDSSSLGFCDGAPHPLDPSLHSPPSKGPTPAWAPRSPALLRHPVQVLARELAAAQEQERAQGCILNRRMGRAQWGPQQPGDAQVTLIPVARARCARRVRLRDPR